MRGGRRRRIMRVAVSVVAVTIVVAAGVGVYTQATAFSYNGLLAALTAHGAEVHETGTASNLTFTGAGHSLTINSTSVAAYSYRTTVAAQLDASRVSSDGSTFRGGVWPFGGSAVIVEWTAPPHHYRRGRVIVSYIGNDESIVQLLTSVLGPPFAEGHF